MTWDTFPWGAVLTAAVILSSMVLLAMDERNRRKFVVKDEGEASLKRIHRRIDAVEGSVQGVVSLHASIDDRVGDIEKQVTRMDERQTQQWERISEQMQQTAKTLESVMKEVADVAKQLDRMQRN